MIDSGTKLPENRIHLFDPVGLINDGYCGYRSSSYAARPRRPVKSYSNFEDLSSNNDNSGLRSYDSYTDPNHVDGLRSYDSFSMETNGGVGGIRSYEQSIDEQDDTRNSKNGGGIRFGVDNNVAEEEEDVTTPRLWDKPSSKAMAAESPQSFSHKNSSKSSLNSPSSPLHPSLKPMSSNNSNNSVSVTSLQTTSLKSVNSSPLHQHYNQNMSPSSRTQAIAKGRRELMEMVRDLPESFYELSLKDIVEQKAEMEVQNKEIDVPEEKKTVKESSNSNGGNTIKGKETKTGKKSGKKVKKSESKKKMVRSRSVDNGRFLLRTSVFPIFSGSKKSRKNLGPSNSFKIAPMPKPQSNGSMKVVEKDWWRRKSCISNDSDDTTGLSSTSGSSSSSSRSSSSNGRRGNRFLPSCCLFNGRRIRSKK